MRRHQQGIGNSFDYKKSLAVTVKCVVDTPLLTGDDALTQKSETIEGTATAVLENK